MEDLNRAHEFATKVDEPGVWSELANAYLEHAQVGRGRLGRWSPPQVPARRLVSLLPNAEGGGKR